MPENKFFNYSPDQKFQICFQRFFTSLPGRTQCLDTHPDKAPGAGKIKDLAAGAVLAASVISLIIGLIIFLPKIFK